MPSISFGSIGSGILSSAQRPFAVVRHTAHQGRTSGSEVLALEMTRPIRISGSGAVV
jgi:hypothetical protein